MLLLPLLIVWAKAPMRYSTTNLRMLIAACATLTFLSPLLLTDPLVASDPFDRGGNGFGSSSFDVEEEEPARLNKDDDDEEKKVKQLREGTLVPPTAGRVVMIGRRWAFLPASVESAKAAPPETANQTNNLFTGSSAAARPIDPQADLVLGNRLTSQLLVCENLMLQRVVEAIRDDPSDDKWTVSGVVTEFFDQNLFVIKTAQRSNSN